MFEGGSYRLLGPMLPFWDLAGMKWNVEGCSHGEEGLTSLDWRTRIGRGHLAGRL